jgi:hypothetical protein
MCHGKGLSQICAPSCPHFCFPPSGASAIGRFRLNIVPIATWLRYGGALVDSMVEPIFDGEQYGF